ncbi:sigma-70 family RNA polymerase sigma factor [Streptomyces sp. NBC_00090]|uniref:sigma-70 family RNA polymerase sigma factor n=1 Tax=Streptomyces sp. NBC_00090 TaxID=2903619 RepID=UPI0032538337
MVPRPLAAHEDIAAALPDAELGSLVRATGDASALSELYTRHQPAVLAYARTFVRDPHTAEDLASEAFARTIRAVRAGKGPEAAWRPYLLSVVRHTAADWADSARRTELIEDFERWFDAWGGAVGNSTDEADTQSSETRMLELEDRSMILRAFRSLPDRWQAALWHSVVEGDTTARTGALLGVSPSGVASLTARAREGLREAYLSAHAESSSRSEGCRRYSALLGAAIRRPGGREHRLLKRHLDSCAHCRHAVVELTDLNQRLRAVLPAALLLWGGPAYLAGRFTDVAAGAARGTGDSGGETAGRGAASAAKAWGAVAVSGLALGSLLFLQHDDAPTSTQPQAVDAPTSAPPQAVEGERTPSATTPTTTAPPDPLDARKSGIPLAEPTKSAGPASWSPVADDRTRLRLAATGQCVEIPDGRDAIGVQAREAPCDGGPNQQWDLLRPDRSNRVQLRNVGTGKCLANSASEEDGSPVVQAVCVPEATRQLWTLYAPARSGEARFIQEGDTMYLGLSDWWKAEKGRPHESGIGTSHHYYGSPSFGFVYDGALFDEKPPAG